MARSKKNGGPSKMNMVREALAALGNDAKTKDIHDHVFNTHGVDLSSTMISTYKSVIKGKSGKTGQKKRGRPAKSGVTGKAASSGDLSMADLTAVKAMVGKFGASKLSDIIQLLSK